MIVALLPFLHAELSPEEFDQLRQTLAGLQMAYGQIAQEAGDPAASAPAAETGSRSRRPSRPGPDSPRGDV